MTVPLGTLTNCYAEGGSVNCFDVRGRFSGSVRYLGGLVGYSSGSITNCYAGVSVSGSDNVGGLVGFNYESDITASFWDIQTSGQDTSAGGTGKTTAEIQMGGTVEDTALCCMPPSGRSDRLPALPRVRLSSGQALSAPMAVVLYPFMLLP